jgi:hypothetical protein
MTLALWPSQLGPDLFLDFEEQIQKRRDIPGVLWKGTFLRKSQSDGQNDPAQ